MILCTQYNDEEWYGRIDSEYDEGSPIAEAIIDHITNNAYDVLYQAICSVIMPHMKQASSRAIAVLATLCFLLFQEPFCSIGVLSVHWLYLHKQ